MNELYLEDRIAIVARMLNEQSMHAFQFSLSDPRNEFILRMINVLHGRIEEVPIEYSFLIGKRKARK